MKQNSTPDGDGSRTAAAIDTADLVVEAEAQLLRAGRRLGELVDRLEAGDLTAAGEVPAVVATLDKALGAVFSERARRERNGGSSAAAGQLDLGAARAEIERRLARLRATLDADGPPGRVE